MPCAIFCPIPPTLQLQFHELFYSFSISNPFHESCVTYANSHVACMCIHCIFNCIHVIGQDVKLTPVQYFFPSRARKYFCWVKHVKDISIWSFSRTFRIHTDGQDNIIQRYSPPYTSSLSHDAHFSRERKNSRKFLFGREKLFSVFRLFFVFS